MAVFNCINREQTSLMPMAVLICCFLLAFMESRSHAYEFRVGGTSGWAVPNNKNTERYNQWAGRNRFQVGDSLVFVYNSSEDSVLQVTHRDYRSCSTSHPIALFKDGNTVFKLPHSGSFFFVSGASGHCQKSEKLHVIVLSIRGGSSPSQSPHGVASPVPAHAPAHMMGTPAPSPSSSMATQSAPRSSTSATTAPPPPVQSAGFVCALLIFLCVLNL